MFKIRNMLLLKLSLLIIMLFTILATTSCTDSSNKTGKNTIKILSAKWIYDKFDLFNASKEYEAENPGVTVTIDQYYNYETSYYPLMDKSNQNRYDIVLGLSREQIVQYAASGSLTNFDDNFFDENIKKEDFFPSFLELGNINGKQYMLPLMGEVMAIVVRKDLFANEGLLDEKGEPIAAKTWEELYNYAKKLTKDQKNGQKLYGLNIDFGENMLDYTFYASLQAKKGNIFDIKSNTVDTSSEDFKYILTMWRNLVSNGLTPTYTFENMDAGRENFKFGNVAMLLSTHSRFTELASEMGADKIAIMPIPGVDKNGSLTYIHGITIPYSSTNKDLAKSFIKEKLLSNSLQAKTMASYGKIPSLIKNYDTALSPDWITILSWVKNATTMPVDAGWPSMDKIIQGEIRNYILGSQTLERTITNIKSQIDTANKDSGH